MSMGFHWRSQKSLGEEAFPEGTVQSFVKEGWEESHPKKLDKIQIEKTVDCSEIASVHIDAEIGRVLVVSGDEINSSMRILLVGVSEENRKINLHIRKSSNLLNVRVERENDEVSNSNVCLLIILPTLEIDFLSIRGVEGDIEVKDDISVRSLEISNSNGDVHVETSEAKKLRITSIKGNIWVRIKEFDSIILKTNGGNVILETETVGFGIEHIKSHVVDQRNSTNAYDESPLVEIVAPSGFCILKKDYIF